MSHHVEPRPAFAEPLHRERLDDHARFTLNTARLGTEPYRETIDAINAIGLLNRVSPTGYVIVVGVESNYAYDPLSGRGYIRGEEVEFEDHEDFLAFFLEMEALILERLQIEA